MEKELVGQKEWLFLLFEEGPVVLVLRAWLKERSDSWKGSSWG